MSPQDNQNPSDTPIDPGTTDQGQTNNPTSELPEVPEIPTAQPGQTITPGDNQEQSVQPPVTDQNQIPPETSSPDVVGPTVEPAPVSTSQPAEEASQPATAEASEVPVIEASAINPEQNTALEQSQSEQATVNADTPAEETSQQINSDQGQAPNTEAGSVQMSQAQESTPEQPDTNPNPIRDVSTQPSVNKVGEVAVSQTQANVATPQTDQAVQQPAQTPSPKQPKPKKGKKIALIIATILIVLGIIGAGGYFALGFINSANVPTYSDLNEATLSGYTASESGVKFRYPVEFEISDDASDTEVQYLHYNTDESDGVKTDESIYGGIFVSVRSLRTGDIPEPQRVEAIKEFKTQVETEGGFEEFFGENIDNLEVVKNEVDENQASLNFELTGDSKPKDDKESEKGTLSGKFIVGNGYLYTIVVTAEQEVWEKNQTLFVEILNTAEFDQ